MIVEFLGSSGAGKTTVCGLLAERLRRAGANVVAIHHGDHAPSPLPPSLRDPDRFDIRTDLRLLPWSLMFAMRHARFVAFVLGQLTRISAPPGEKTAILRSVGRKMGLFQYLCRGKFAGAYVLVDEGILHIAHNILVSPRDLPSAKAVARFAALVPLPDRAILLCVPVATASARLGQRGDLSPRVRSADELQRFLANARTVFDGLADAPRLRPALIDHDAQNHPAGEIAARIHEILIADRNVARGHLS